MASGLVPNTVSTFIVISPFLYYSSSEPSDSVTRELILVKIKAEPAQRQQVISITEIFRANIVDVAKDSLMIEITGSQSKLKAFLSLVEDYEILELVRTGITGLARGEK